MLFWSEGQNPLAIWCLAMFRAAIDRIMALIDELRLNDGRAVLIHQ